MPAGNSVMADASILPAVERALKGLDYGAVHLTVHDGHVVRIERIERMRLTDSSGSQKTLTGQPTPFREERRIGGKGRCGVDG